MIDAILCWSGQGQGFLGFPTPNAKFGGAGRLTLPVYRLMPSEDLRISYASGDSQICGALLLEAHPSLVAWLVKLPISLEQDLQDKAESVLQLEIKSI